MASAPMNPFTRGYLRGLAIREREQRIRQQEEESRLRIEVLRHRLSGEKLEQKLRARTAQEAEGAAREKGPSPVLNLPNPRVLNVAAPGGEPLLTPQQFQKAPVRLDAVADEEGAEILPARNVVPRSVQQIVSGMIEAGQLAPAEVGGRTLNLPPAVAANLLARRTEPKARFFVGAGEDDEPVQMYGEVIPDAAGGEPRVRTTEVGPRAVRRTEFEKLFEREYGELPKLSDKRKATTRTPASLAYARAFEGARVGVHNRIGRARLKNRGAADVRSVVDEFLSEAGAKLAGRGINTGKLRGDLLKVFDVTNPRGSGGSAPRSDAEKEHAAANLAAAGARMTLSAARASRDPVRIRAAEEAYQRAVERLDKVRAAFQK